MKTKRIKIRPTLSFFLIVLISSVVLIVLSIQYYFSKDLAFTATKDNFTHIAQKVEQKIKSMDKRNNDMFSILGLYKNVKNIPKVNQRHPLLPLITKMLKNYTYIYAIYASDKNENFYEVINLKISKNLLKKYKFTQEMEWLVVKIYEENNQRVQYEEYLDKNLNRLALKKSISNYYPSRRPWYKQAQLNSNIIKTDPYLFSNLEAKGITYSKKVEDSDIILGIDVSFESMNKFLKNQVKIKDNKIFLFKKNGKITSYLNHLTTNEGLEVVPYPEILNSTKTKNSKKYSSMQINNEEYFVYFSEIGSIYKNKDYLSILVPVDEIMKPYIEKIASSFFITLIILSFSLPIIWYLTRVLSEPIHKLSAENEKILNRNFDSVKVIDTNIKELFELSESLVNMSISIKEYQNRQKVLMDSFIKLIASAIDAKSKYTGGHCERVPILTNLIAKKASASTEGIFKDFSLKNKEEERELSIAAWLHDCGKVTTPEYVVDKATKLETIYNRIHEIRTRFEVIYRDLIIQSYKNILDGANQEQEEKALKEEQNKLFEEFSLIATANIGSEFMADKDIKEVEKIAKRTWVKYFDDTLGVSRDEKNRMNRKEKFLPYTEYLLADKKEHIIKREDNLDKAYEKYNFKLEVPKDLYNLGEVYNLSIKKGTLTHEERFKINEHMIMSIIMLEELPLTDNLKRVPEYATAHHETLIGTGYPRKLTKKDMSIPARIMALSDVFEALTASDRPYKEAKTLSESIKILSFMVKDKHIDPDIFKLFLKSGAYKEYSSKYLKEEQIDDVDISKYI